MTTWRKVGCCLAAVAELAFGAVAEVPASAYVKQGLVANWDGIDNLADGSHHADATVWRDRVAGREFALTGVTVGERYFKFNNSSTSYGVLTSGATEAFPSGVKTVEIVAKLGSDGIALHGPTSSGVSFGRFESHVLLSNFKDLSVGYANPGSDVANIYCTVYGEGNLPTDLNLNGAAVTPSASVTYWGSPDADKAWLGKRSNAKECDCTIFAIRVYGRKLTEREIAYNAAIDKIRFMGARPEDVLPDGYRQNAAGDGIEVRVRAFVLDGSGTISVNGAFSQSSNEVWFAKGAAVKAVFSPNPEGEFLVWVGAPADASYPETGAIEFAANAPASLEAKGGDCDNPVLTVSAPEQVRASSFQLPYEVSYAGSAAEDVTLYVCYGQDPERLSNTNTYEHVIGSGTASVTGLIQSRTYYVKVVADGNGHVAESALQAVTTGEGEYGDYEAAQPVVKTVISRGLQESLRVCGDMTAPEGTKLTVYYGASAEIGTMTAVEFEWTQWHQPDGCCAIVGGVAPGAYFLVVELRNGSYLDRYPTVATATALAAVVEPAGTRRAAVFDGNSYLQTTRIPAPGVFTGPFTMCVWAKNPRGSTTGTPHQDGLNRLASIMRCEEYMISSGPSLHLRCPGWTVETDDEFCANPKYELTAELYSGGISFRVCVGEPEIWKDNKWHLIAMTWDPESNGKMTLALYLDGKKAGEADAPGGFKVVDPSRRLTFGAYPNSTHLGRLIGSLAEAAVWKRVLSDKEIRRLMRYTADPNDPSLVGHWLTSDAPYTVDRSKTASPNDLTISGSVSFDAVKDLKIRPNGFVLLLK